MFKKSIFVLACIFCTQIAYSQQVYFCTKVSGAGIPGDPSNYWVMKKNGGTLTVLYSQDSIIKDSIYILVLKKDEDKKGVYENVSQMVMPFVKGRKFEVTAYNFQETGKYRIRVYTPSKVLADGNVTIALEGQQLVPLSNYKNANLVFCTKVKNNKPLDTSGVFGLTSNPGFIKGYITNDRPLGSSNIYVQVLRKSGKDYLAIDNFNFYTEPTHKAAFFDIPFKDGGEYEIVVRNEESTLIKAMPVKIYMSELINEKK